LEKAFEIKRFSLDIASKKLAKRHREMRLQTAHPVPRTMTIFSFVHHAAPF
jgi:hypothetical protein